MIFRLLVLGGIVWLALPVRGADTHHRVANISMIMTREYRAFHLTENPDVRNFSKAADHLAQNLHVPQNGELAVAIAQVQHLKNNKALLSVASFSRDRGRDEQMIQKVGFQTRMAINNIQKSLRTMDAQVAQATYRIGK